MSSSFCRIFTKSIDFFYIFCNNVIMEMKPIGERVYIIRKYNKLTQTEFGHKMGLTHATISATEAGKVPLTEANLLLICLTFGIREEWLRYGTGEMFVTEEQQEHILLDVFRHLSDSGKQDVYEFAEFRLQKEEQVARVEKQAPVAGSPLEPLPAGGYEEDRFVG
jgi:transcriptional regulator with XRE-family HTH domain